MPLTLAVSPETLQSWLNLSREHPGFRTSVNAVRTAASSSANDLLPQPFVPIDLPAFEAAALGDYLANEFVAGSATFTISPVYASTPALRSSIRSTAPSLTRLRSLLFQQLLVREGEVVPEQPNLTPAQPFTLASTDTTFDAASANPTVESWLNGDEPAGEYAQRFVAGLSLIALEAPAAGRHRHRRGDCPRLDA